MSAENQSPRTARSTTPYLQEILRSDPFARFLRRNRVSPMLFGSFVFMYSFIRTLVLPAAFGHLFTVEMQGRAILGALDDWPVLVIELIMVPVVAGYYLWQPNTMQMLYDGISEKIGPNPLSRAKAMEYVRPVRWSGWAVVAFVIGIFEALYIQFVFQRDDVLIWETVNATMVASYILIRFTIFYMLVYIIVRQVFMIIAVNRLFLEVPVTITPLHPDKAGGLRILGDYVLSIALVIGAVGLYFGMGFVRQEWNPYVITTEFYVLLAIYFFLAPLFFLLPLTQVHRRMKEAKRKLLLEIADQFDIEYRKLLAGLKNDQLEPDLALRVETIHKIYKLAEDAPEWPFSFEIVSKFGAATILPVLIPLGVEVTRGWLSR